MTAVRRRIWAAPVLVIALALAGCGDSQEPETATETSVEQAEGAGEEISEAGEEPDETTGDGDAPDDDASADDNAPHDEDDDAADDEGADDEGAAADGEPGEDGALEISSTGQGPIGLSTPQAPEGEARTTSGKLIVGPGSCFSLAPQDRPQLLVFADDAEFQTGQGKPTVTTDALGSVSVGEQVELSAVEYSQDDLDGIPQQCAQGADDTVLVVTG